MKSQKQMCKGTRTGLCEPMVVDTTFQIMSTHQLPNITPQKSGTNHTDIKTEIPRMLLLWFRIRTYRMPAKQEDLRID